MLSWGLRWWGVVFVDSFCVAFRLFFLCVLPKAPGDGLRRAKRFLAQGQDPPGSLYFHLSRFYLALCFNPVLLRYYQEAVDSATNVTLREIPSTLRTRAHGRKPTVTPPFPVFPYHSMTL